MDKLTTREKIAIGMAVLCLIIPAILVVVWGILI